MYFSDAINALFKGLLVVCAITVPLALWKLIDLLALASHHISLTLH